VSGFTIRGFDADGLHLACVDGFSITNNVADANGVYGFFPIVSRNGVIARNEVVNTVRDAGIYVGQSDSVVVEHNRVHDNLLGIEIENSRKCSVVENEIHDNTFGLFVDLQPFLQRTTAEGTLVALNLIHDNNRPNSSEPGDPLALLPPGIGVLLVGADGTSVWRNTVSGNQFAGIGVASFCLALALQGQPCGDLDIEPNPDGNRIVGNRLDENGTVPIADPMLDSLRADLVWDGSGSGNCWSANVFDTSVPPDLPPCL
jgi:parallel beta-helix repeat protein